MINPMKPPSTKPSNIKIKSELPLLALRGAVVFPRIAAPLFILDKASLKAIDAAMKGDRLVVCVAVNKEKTGALTSASEGRRPLHPPPTAAALGPRPGSPSHYLN